MNIWVNAATALLALIITALCGFPLVPALKRLKFGQTISEYVAEHKGKQGTPTMGGFMFIIGIIVAFSAGLVMLSKNKLILPDSLGTLQFWQGVSGLLMALGFGFVGFLDDFIKVRKKHNEGLTVNQKLLLQALIVAAYFTSRVLAGDKNTSVYFPFLGSVDLWYFYYILMGLAIIYIVNAVNLTDGIDGLCSSVTLVYCAAMMFICNILRQTELSLLAVTVAGACAGFLIWNFHPAKVFMGDVGSMFLGGIVCALGAGAGREAVMIIAAAVFIWEALTVLIQVAYYKATGGKRLFKKTPIHHSFELKGWTESKIVIIFSCIAAAFGAAATLLVLFDTVR